MKPFDDILPEETEPQHEELITLLQRAYHKPVLVTPDEQEQIIARVRERLMKTDLGDSLKEDRPLSQVGMFDSSPPKPVIHARLRRDGHRFRLVGLLAAALLVTVLLSTSLLLLRTSWHGGTASTLLPTLTFSQNAAQVGNTVTITLKHLTPSARVVLTHDFLEPILVNGSSTITTDTQGTARFSLVIGSKWGPGFHVIVAEDVATRNTASAALQIIGQGSPPPPHLVLDSSPIHMGADVVGANTTRSLTLSNSGSGSISWSASSDQSWLLVSPSQGTFSQNQTLSLAVQRVGLKPGYYAGSITISTNVNPPQHIEVDMTVGALPLTAGAVLALPPAPLSFTTTDGDPKESVQSLSISNPGLRPLHWSLAIDASATSRTQLSLANAQGSTCNWLRATPNTGTVAAGATSALKIMVHSQCLLPGEYIGMLNITAAGAIDGVQTVNVSLVVQPHCSLVTSAGNLAFTVVQGQHNVSNQNVSLNASASCVEMPISWTSMSTASWLTITPASGQIKGYTNTLVPIHVIARSIAPGIYSGAIVFVTGHSTLTVMVQLTVQAAPPQVSPIMGVSPLNLNFDTTQDQPNPTGQVVTITNTGGSTLKWNASRMSLAPTWLDASTTGGTIAPRQSEHLTINVNTTQLTPGNYVGQITLNGMFVNDHLALGSPQTITINLVVQPPCTISPPSSSSLSFSAVQGVASNPAAQTVMFTGWGSCVWPVTWTTNVAPAASWLTLMTSVGTVKGTGQTGSIEVVASTTSVPVGTYSTQVTIAAIDASGATVQGSPQTFMVTLTVLPPCVLSPPSASLTFSVNQGQPSLVAQHVSLSEKGACVRPVTWTASEDAKSSSWLVLPTTSGSDSGGGSILGGINVNATNLTPGIYTGTITIAATDSTGAPISGSGQSVSVTLTVTGYTVSGNVVACPGSTPPTCVAPQALPGAAVTLMSGSSTVATTTADASGNYAFSNIALGVYTISVAGYDVSTNHYLGSLSLTLTGNALNATIQVFPG